MPCVSMLPKKGCAEIQCLRFWYCRRGLLPFSSLGERRGHIIRVARRQAVRGTFCMREAAAHWAAAAAAAAAEVAAVR